MVDSETTPDGCHEWAGRLTASGYGWFNPGPGGGTRAAHRWILEYHLGRKLERDELVLHSCDNRPCTRIAHLRVGTASDNMRDVVERNPNHNANRALCVRGHELSGDNLYADKRGRRCKKCTKLRERGYAEKRRKENPPPPPATHCINGHEWNDENTHITKRGYRVCRACHRERERARQQRIREEKRARSTPAHDVTRVAST
ncbi:HNH endonuclease [Streptomyces turgidiscabies]|uniref:HNH endonuclease n=1 Tax=Streptomyces turgidiscabies TaxID=85558 RepID=UPI0038F7399F